MPTPRSNSTFVDDRHVPRELRLNQSRLVTLSYAVFEASKLHDQGRLTPDEHDAITAFTTAIADALAVHDDGEQLSTALLGVGTESRPTVHIQGDLIDEAAVTFDALAAHRLALLPFEEATQVLPRTEDW